jgi:hypothetical protein
MSGRWLGSAFACAVAFAAVAGWPELAGACSVCLSASDETREAYYATTVLLAVLPFALIGGIAFWLRRYALSAARRSAFVPTTTEAGRGLDQEQQDRRRVEHSAPRAAGT